ncbi:hypothetical protein O0L34_g2233 [Tuta absoluta]|nr:hypothetical protein O0L34_g2233 [Tuta absoluta]
MQLCSLVIRALMCLTVIICGLFKHAHGLKCYQCSTIKNPHGCYPYDLKKEYLADCPERGVRPMCRTISQVQYFTPDQEVTVVRECAYIHADQDDCELSRFSTMHYSQSCECSEDGCNNASRLGIAWPVAVLLAAIALA